MFYTEKDLKDTLGKELEISELAEQRIEDTYREIRGKRKESDRKHGKRKGMHAAAAAAATVILLSGTTVGAAYLSTHMDLLEHVFGQGSRQSQEAYDKVIEDGKGGQLTVTMPSREYVDVDEEQAKLAGQYAEEQNIVRSIGDYTLTVIDHMTDGNAGVVSMKLECADGIRALAGDQETNEAKGVYFTEDRDFSYSLEDVNGNLVAEKTVIDLERSTDTCWYLYASYVCTEPVDGLQLHLEQYDKKVSEADEYEGMNTIREEDILLTSQQMPRIEVVNEENGKRQFAYSEISLSLNLSNGFSLDEYVSEDGDSRFVDPYYVRYLALEYEDGSSYVILDQDNNVDNTNYVCGGMGEEQDVMNLVFNRMVDWGKVEKLVVNDVEFLIEE